MVILSRVCADFYDKNGVLLHRITRRDLGNFRIAPDSIKQDPLFDMLLSDGSLEAPVDKATQKKLENDPDKKPEKTETAGTAPAEAKASDGKTAGKK